MPHFTGFHINRQRIGFIVAVSVVVILAISLIIGSTISSVRNQVTRASFEELEIAAKQLANELQMAVGSDHTTLSAIATIIANQDEISDEELSRIINSYDFNSTYISHLTVLKPDNTMLFSSGTVKDVSQDTRFAEEVEKGEYISGLRQSNHDPSINVVHHAVPVIKNGEVLFILYGIVELPDLAERYTTGLYEGHAYVYIEDGDNGDLILDSWHKTQGNILDLGQRKMLEGYSLEKAIDDMSKGISGEIAFISQTTGAVLFLRYEPLGINNWNVMITVEEKFALAKSYAVTNSLYLMAGICGAILLLYFGFVLSCLLDTYRQVKKLGTQDQNTGLQNRNAFDKFVSDNQKKVFSLISCVFIDVNGLHSLNNEQGHAEGDKMLQVVAKALQKEFDYLSLFRIGGDEFIAFSETNDNNACTEKVNNISRGIEGYGYSVASGIVSYQNETGLGRCIKDADALMLDNKRKYYSEHNRRRQ